MRRFSLAVFVAATFFLTLTACAAPTDAGASDAGIKITWTDAKVTAPALTATTTTVKPVPVVVTNPPCPPVEKQKWWQAVLSALVDVVVGLGTPILILLISRGLKKLGLNAERDTVEWIVTKAVGYGEQRAKIALKDGKPMEGPAILIEALGHGKELLVKKGLLNKWGSSLADLIEAKLGEEEAKSPNKTSKTAEKNGVVKPDEAEVKEEEGPEKPAEGDKEKEVTT